MDMRFLFTACLAFSLVAGGKSVPSRNETFFKAIDGSFHQPLPTPFGKLQTEWINDDPFENDMRLNLDEHEVTHGPNVQVLGFGKLNGDPFLLVTVKTNEQCVNGGYSLRVVRPFADGPRELEVAHSSLASNFTVDRRHCDPFPGGILIGDMSGFSFCHKGSSVTEVVKGYFVDGKLQADPRPFKPLELSGKGPQDIDIWSDQRFLALLRTSGFTATQVEDAKFRLSVVSPFRREGEWVVQYGNAPHLGGTDTGALAIHGRTGKVHYIGLEAGKAVSCIGFRSMGELCPGMVKRLDDAYVACHESSGSLPSGPFPIVPAMRRASGLQKKIEEARRAALRGPLPSKPIRGRVTRDKFRELVLGKSMGEVLAIFGKPARTDEMSHIFWTYHGRTFDPVTGRGDWSASVQFSDGFADRVDFGN